MNSSHKKFALRPEVVEVFRTSRGVFISTCIFSGLVNLLMLTGPLFMLQVYDRVLTSGSVPTLIALGSIVAALYAYFGFLDFIRTRLMVRVGRRVEDRFRDPVFNALTWHSLHSSPSVGAQPIADLSTVRQFLSGQGPFAFFDMPWVPVYIFVIYLMHWALGTVAAVAAGVISIVAIISEFAIRRPLEEATTASIKASVISDESRLNAEALHSLGMLGTMRTRWSDISRVALDRHTTSSDIGGGLGAFSRVVRLMIQSGILGLGAYLAIGHEISAGTIVAAAIILSRALAPVEQAIGNWQFFLSYRKAIKRLNQAIQTMPAEVSRTRLPKPKGKLEVENLLVQVPEREKPLLTGISFSVRPGEGLGIIGPTGSGKSTLARALVGVLPLTRGTVRLDGATLDQFERDVLGRLIGYLPQDVQLFSGTVTENIARFDPDPNPEDIINAAKLANVHEMILKLPQGYDTPIRGIGSRLSGGQRQRVALARALYGNPVLLVFDEPNSSLDGEGEAALNHAIQHSLARGASVVVVAHRAGGLAAIKQMLVLNEGAIVALGPRDDIMRKVLVRPVPKSQPLSAGGAA